jgi:hypothetical protein
MTASQLASTIRTDCMGREGRTFKGEGEGEGEMGAAGQEEGVEQ